jgi:hypothetical protein
MPRIVMRKVRKDGRPNRGQSSYPVEFWSCQRREVDAHDPGVIRVNLNVVPQIFAISLTEAEARSLVTMLEYAIAGADLIEELPTEESETCQPKSPSTRAN